MPLAKGQKILMAVAMTARTLAMRLGSEETLRRDLPSPLVNARAAALHDKLQHSRRSGAGWVMSVSAGLFALAGMAAIVAAHHGAPSAPHAARSGRATTLATGIYDSRRPLSPKCSAQTARARTSARR